MTQEAQLVSPTNVQPESRRLRSILPKDRAHRIFVLLGSALLVGGVAIFFWLSRETDRPSFVTTRVDTGAVVRVVSGTGTVNPVLTIIVGSYVSGVIQDISCDFNTQVHKGQLCAKIDPRPYQTVVNQSAADLATAKAQLIKDQANLVYAQLNFKRNQDLLAAAAVSQDAADVARNAFNQAQAQVALDQATIQERQAALDAANVNLGYTNITSPVDGTVVSRNVTIGQTVAASFQTPTLFLIATDLTKMEVDTNVSESDVGALRVGEKATFTVEAYPERIFQGAVVQVRQAPQSVQNVITYDIVIAIDNKNLLLKPGMTATTRIITAERDNVLRVPDQAVRYSPGQERNAAGQVAGSGHVWVLRNGQPVEQPVKLGLDDDSYTEILGGLDAGAQVIVGERAETAATPKSTAPRMY